MFFKGKLIGIIFFLLTASLFADGTFYEKYYPKPDNPVQGELVYAAFWRIWIPPHVDTLRGVVVHQHGCGGSSCESGRTAVDDLHWQALARKYDCALIGVSYKQDGDCELWCDPRNGSASSFLNALADFAQMSGHPELNTIPWAIWGHSGGGQWCGTMVHLYPERVVGAWLRSGHSDTVGRTFDSLPLTDEFLQVPIIFNVGTGEKTSSLKPMYENGFQRLAQLRGLGAKVGYLIDPKTDHETGSSRYPAIRFLDECLAVRLPDVPGTAELRSAPEGVILKPVPEQDEALVSLLPDGFWLPSEEYAEVWRNYSADASYKDTTPPPAPFDVTISEDGELTWDVIADAESGLAGFTVRQGDSVWNIPEDDRNPFGPNLWQGLRYSDTPLEPVPPLRFSVPDYCPCDNTPITISARNTCGLKSEAVAAKP